MHYFYWIAGTVLALAWFSRIVEAALGMPSVADISKPEWDRNLLAPSASPRVSIIVPARNEEAEIEQALTRLLRLEYDNYEVIAVNDRSTDGTGEIMERVARNQSRLILKVIHHAELPPAIGFYLPMPMSCSGRMPCGGRLPTPRPSGRIMWCCFPR
jgi:cellulose synthase/poly-beta-1,6-N-acetylglucosamine synthase-like glycosyltransferase